MKSILDPSFRYRSSVHTDLKITFAEIRRKQRKDRQAARVHASGNFVLRMPSGHAFRNSD